MIQLVDAALADRVREGLGRPAGLTVEFTPPTGGKRPGETPGTKTVGIYLHDIREDLDRRQTGTVNLYSDDKPDPWKVAHHDPPRYARLSYLVTAWASDPLLSHQMLGDLLIDLARDREFAVQLPESLEAMGLSALLEVGRPPIGERALAELWSAVGHFLQPVLNVTVVLPLPTHMPAFYTHWVTKKLELPDDRIEFPLPTPPPHWKKWPPKPKPEPKPEPQPPSTSTPPSTPQPPAAGPGTEEGT
ncbi:DUF4255 domain-containing protein [Streptomyces inhibens]|uniref:DUF4255 domain-containing protein n=1 Tax=Streptomyces inhibens TaxID=2293571 RepID=UPI00402AC2F2